MGQSADLGTYHFDITKFKHVDLGIPSNTPQRASKSRRNLLGKNDKYPLVITQPDSYQKLELQWFLESLQPSLGALKEGLEDCVALLASKEPGSTLVLSSLRSESVKGFVTRVGTKLVKGVRQHVPTVKWNC